MKPKNCCDMQYNSITVNNYLPKYLIVLNIGRPKSIDFPFVPNVPNGKSMVLDAPIVKHIRVHLVVPKTMVS